jgi:hypothetical protein
VDQHFNAFLLGSSSTRTDSILGGAAAILGKDNGAPLIDGTLGLGRKSSAATLVRRQGDQ